MTSLQHDQVFPEFVTLRMNGGRVYIRDDGVYRAAV